MTKTGTCGRNGWGGKEPELETTHLILILTFNFKQPTVNDNKNIATKKMVVRMPVVVYINGIKGYINILVCTDLKKKLIKLWHSLLVESAPC